MKTEKTKNTKPENEINVPKGLRQSRIEVRTSKIGRLIERPFTEGMLYDGVSDLRIFSAMSPYDLSPSTHNGNSK